MWLGQLVLLEPLEPKVTLELPVLKGLPVQPVLKGSKATRVTLELPVLPDLLG